MGEDDDLVEMTNEQLSEYLNATVGDGDRGVTVDVVRQWVRWKVLPRATGRGRGIGRARSWSRSGGNLQQAFRLTELRKAGLTSRDSLQAQMWIEGWPIDFGLARAAITNRFHASSAKMKRGITTNFDPRTASDVSPSKKRAVTHQMGRQADIFRESSFALNSNEALSAFAATFFGAIPRLDITKLAEERLHTIDPNLGVEDLPGFTAGISGLLGDPDEIERSGVATLTQAAQREFELARRAFLNSQRVFLLLARPEMRDKMPNKWEPFLSIAHAIKDQVSLGDFAVLGLCQHLQGIHLAPDKFDDFLEQMSRQESEFDMLDKALEILPARDENAQ